MSPKSKTTTTKEKTAAERRKERLAEQLRVNLKRRKTQARERKNNNG